MWTWRGVVLIGLVGCASGATPATHAGQRGGSSPEVEPSLKVTAVSKLADTGDGVIGIRMAGPDVTFKVALPYTGFEALAPDLETVRACTNEWDREFALVANTVVPFADLQAHVGSEPFCGGHSYFDWVTRAYVSAAPPAAVLDGIRAGAATLDRLGYVGDQPPPQIPATRQVTGWDRHLINYQRFYIDYGGVAKVELHVRPVGTGSLVMMFMYVRDPSHRADGVEVDPMGDVLRSVAVGG